MGTVAGCSSDVPGLGVAQPAPCVIDRTCEVLTSAEITGGRIDLIAVNEAAIAAVLVVGEVPQSELIFAVHHDSLSVSECVSLGATEICSAQVGTATSRSTQLLFSVKQGVIRPIGEPFEVYGVTMLQPLDHDELLLWSWTSSAGIGHASVTGKDHDAWQTWVVSETSVELAGCGPSELSGHNTIDPPKRPLRLPCP